MSEPGAPAARADGRLERGRRTRQAVLGQAAAIASAEGLDGLSIGRLAHDLDLSKAGVFAHFGSKEELQLATIEYASDVFAEHVVAPSLSQQPGPARLQALCRNWIDYAERCIFPGGCFFFAVSAEFDSRPGRIRDAVAQARRAWVELLRDSVVAAQSQGGLSAEVDPRQLAFELDAVGMAANLDAQLFSDPGAYQLARHSIEQRLESLIVPSSTS